MNEENSLWMGDISPDVDESVILQSFQYFNIYPINIKFIKDKKTNTNRNYCFVFFRNSEEANKALNQLNGKLIPNTNITFKLNKASYHSPINRTIYVGNLNKSITDEILLNFFQLRYNSVNKATVIKEKGVSKGYGFVVFKEESEYKKSLIEMDGVLIQGKNIVVREQKRKDDNSSSNNNSNNNSFNNNNINNNIIINNIINNSNDFNISEYNYANNNINNDILLNYILRNNTIINSVPSLNNLKSVNLLNNKLINNDLHNNINNIMDNNIIINKGLLNQNNESYKYSNFENINNLYKQKVSDKNYINNIYNINNNINNYCNNINNNLENKNINLSKLLNKENPNNNDMLLTYNKNSNKNNKNNNINSNYFNNNFNKNININKDTINKNIITKKDINLKNSKKNRKHKTVIKLEILEKFDEKTLIKKIRDSINNTYNHYKKLYLSNGNDIKSKSIYINLYIYLYNIVSDMFIYYCTDYFNNNTNIENHNNN